MGHPGGGALRSAFLQHTLRSYTSRLDTMGQVTDSAELVSLGGEPGT